MNRPLTILLVVAMVVGMAAPAVALADPSAIDATHDDPLAAQETTTENETNASITSGEMLAGSIGAHQAEIRGDVDRRAFGLQVAAAATNDSKAQVLQRVTERLQERQQELEHRNDTLQAARANGNISESQYRVRMTGMAAEASTVRTMANDTERVAGSIPNETLEANGVNVTAIQQLRERAHTMTGPETARMARQIAGNDVGAPMGPPENVPGMAGGQMGPPGAGNGTAGGPMGPGSNDSNVTTGAGDGPQMGSGGNSPGGPYQGSGGDSAMTTTETSADDTTASTNDSTTVDA